MQDNLITDLALIRTKNVGLATFYKLIDRFGNSEKALKNLEIDTNKAIEDAKLEIEKTIKFGAEIISYTSDHYPKNLLNLPTPPPVLTIKGDKKALNTKSIAIIGTRNASATGMLTAKKLSEKLSGLGFVVVSGLAKGIDAVCHKSSIDKHGTVAVIAGGIDNIYPQENENIYKQISYTKGSCLVSEKPFGYKPFARDFPIRNRIISAMSEAVLVIEATKKSGSILTASYAAKQGKAVLAVPGSPMDKRYEGNNYLIKNGAALIEDEKDVIGNLHKKPPLLKEKIEDFIHLDEDIEQKSLSKKDTIYSLLGYVPVDINDIIDFSGLEPSEVITKISELEIEGRIAKTRGNKIILVN